MAHKLHPAQVNVLFLLLISSTYLQHKSGEKGTWVDVHPIASVSDIRPIEFESEGKQKKFLDLAHTLLYVTVQLVKSDRSEIDGGSKVVPVNLFIHSLFGQLDIDLNGGTILDGSSTYTYRA